MEAFQPRSEKRYVVIVCIPVGEGGQVGGGWGRAHRVAVAEVIGAQVTRWEEHDVAWDEAHDTGTEGAHHARIVRFLKDHEVGAVVVGHMGAGMHHTIQKMGLAVHTGAEGNARDAVVTATQA
ncbi:MAG: dinitrogenase iron-molybdenum cofactor [Nocardioidaceae bacterium]|nr:dinitrogenase iron-molybdenum cofactor [Nocardioidaceae bacterium]